MDLVIVFSIFSHGKCKKFDSSNFVQKLNRRTNFDESNKEEGIDMKNQFRK